MSVTIERPPTGLPRPPLAQHDARRAAIPLPAVVAPKPAGPLTYLAASGANVWPAGLSPALSRSLARVLHALTRRPARR